MFKKREDYPYLNNLPLLKEISKETNREVYIKITLDGYNLPVHGITQAGNINMDGASSLRRSCNLTFTTEQIDILNYRWSLNTAFFAEAGIKYNGQIYYFPLGTFLITGFSNSLGVNNYTINLSGQDKMAKLNGTIGGALTAEVNFGYMQKELDDGTWEKREVPIKDIIYNVVHLFGGEDASNIDIDYNSLKEIGGWKLLEYRGDKPLYLLINTEGKIVNLTIHGETTDDNHVRIDSLPSYYQPKKSNENDSEAKEGTNFKLNGNDYQVRKIEYGDTAGYEKVELTYAGDLIAKVGETCTSVLDKIKNMLGGEFEYFYDEFGVFHFQRKKNYLKSKWSAADNITIENWEDDIEYAYEFDDLSMFTSISNTPDIKNIKNDFTIWGNRNSVSGNKIPIHLRVGIQNKPTLPEGYEYDWREWIYQKAKEYYEATDKSTVASTGYEHYYMDLYSFWRELYNPNPDETYEPAWYGSDETLYKHPWKTISSADKNMYTYNEVYVQRNGYYIKLADSLNLSPKLSNDLNNTYNIRNLYKRDYGNNYSLFLDHQSLRDNVTYYVDQQEIYELFPEDKYNLYWKDSSGKLEPFIQYVDIEQIVNDKNYLQEYYIKSVGNVNRQRIKLISLWNALTDVNLLSIFAVQKILSMSEPVTYSVQYSFDADKLTLKSTDKILVAKKYIPEDTCSLLYFKDNKYISYVEYLTENYAVDKNKDIIIDEITLCIRKQTGTSTGENPQPEYTYCPVIDTLTIDKNSLYYKDGANNYTLIAEHYYNNSNLNEDLFILDMHEYEETVSRDIFEEYRGVNWDGRLLTDMIYYRPINYFQKSEKFYPEDHEHKYWHKNVYEAFDKLNFWFDLIEPNDEGIKIDINNYTQEQIGKRSLAKTDSVVSAISLFETPAANYGEMFSAIGEDFEALFVVSTQVKSAYDALANLLENHTFIQDKITINSIPIYHLQPNTRIRVVDVKTGLQGDYSVDKVTIPMTYNGMMNITATRIVE